MVQTRSGRKRTVDPDRLADKDDVPPSSMIASQASQEAVDNDRPPAKKRRRVGAAAASPKKRYGKDRRELCQLNLDVLFIIAAHIQPKDLLNLARTCKSLRELLMDRSSAYIWRLARRQVSGLPECPADLCEPAYANLMFCSHCHGCGKYTKTTSWEMRRRYCPGCKRKRFSTLSSCHEIIRTQTLIATERVGGELMVDREQANAVINEYDRSSDKKQFLSDKMKEYATIHQHASRCEHWHRNQEFLRQAELGSRRRQREANIIARLAEHGYSPEIDYFGHYGIRQSYPYIFKSTRPPTDNEWGRIWPVWLRTMDRMRSERLEKTLYPKRQRSLATEFASYLACPPPNTPDVDLLPNAIDIVCFPPFQDVVRAPEDTQQNANSFQSAFEQLPLFVPEWRKNLEVELADLVEIPADLFTKGSRELVGRTHVFDTSSAVRYPDVLRTMQPKTDLMYDNIARSNPALSIQHRFNIKFLKDAPYIIRACGFDPNVATVGDLDRQSARVKCLSCRSRLIWGWRDAMQHAAQFHPEWRVSHGKGLRWELIDPSAEERVSIQKAESANEVKASYWRCLLCRPCVGDAKDQKGEIIQHLTSL